MLAEILLHPQYTQHVVRYFRKELICILHVAIRLENAGENLDFNDHVEHCIILSRIVKLHPDVKRYRHETLSK